LAFFSHLVPYLRQCWELQLVYHQQQIFIPSSLWLFLAPCYV